MPDGSPNDLIAQTIDGKYRIDALIGRGGMGSVYRAIHLGTDRVVALKIINPDSADDPAYVTRFRAEARACGRLRHPNIVDVTDFGVIEHDRRPLSYLVMEYLHGCTLADVLAVEPIPPRRWTIEILEQICDAVEEAHRNAILHRDLKPSNIWLEPNRGGSYSVKVLDFGLAKLDIASVSSTAVARSSAFSGSGGPNDVSNVETVIGAAAPGLISDADSRTRISGTPAYMSPEQARGEAATPQADVYSIGVMAFRMLSGEEPFAGTISELIEAQIHTPPPAIRDINSRLSQDAANLVMSALAKDPAARPGGAGRFGNMLAGRLENPGTTLHRSVVLFFDRLIPFLIVGTIVLSPALLWSLVLAIWSTATTRPTGLPAPTGVAAGAALILLAVLIAIAVFTVSAISVLVLHTVAAPLRPMNLRKLGKVYAGRLRAWLVAMVPVFGLQLLGVGVTILAINSWRILRPWTRSLGDPLQFLIAAPVVLALIGAARWIARQLGGRRESVFLPPVMLVEGMHLSEARTRAFSLFDNSGRLQQRGDMILIAALATIAALAAALVTGAQLTMTSVFRLAPIAVVGLIPALTFVAVLRSLSYLTARRAVGESIADAINDFERAVLPESARGRSHRERIVAQISRS